jgi:hypothetical protein
LRCFRVITMSLEISSSANPELIRSSGPSSRSCDFHFDPGRSSFPQRGIHNTAPPSVMKSLLTRGPPNIEIMRTPSICRVGSLFGQLAILSHTPPSLELKFAREYQVEEFMATPANIGKEPYRRVRCGGLLWLIEYRIVILAVLLPP